MNQPTSRKQLLLKRHRRNKRLSLLIAFFVLVALGWLVTWWLPLVIAVLGWVAHEAWFADHLFYSPGDDYQYSFAPYTQQPKVHLHGERLRLDEGVMLVDDATLVLALRIKSTWLGRFFDPVVELAGALIPIVRLSSGVSTGCVISISPGRRRCCPKGNCACADGSAGCSANPCCGPSNTPTTVTSGCWSSPPCRRRRAGGVWLVQQRRAKLDRDGDRRRNRGRALPADGP